MKRHIVAILAIIVLSLSLTPTLFAHPLNRSSSEWAITITMCMNGFKVVARGVTYSFTPSEVRVDSATELLPYTKPPFILQKRPLPFTSATGSPFVALSPNPHIQVVGTGYYYFTEDKAIGTQVETVISEYINNAVQDGPIRHSTDLVRNCQIPQPVAPVKDLSGVYNPDVALRAPDSFGNDGRTNPDERDHVAVYCVNTGPDAGTIIINGLSGNGSGYRLAQFTLAELGSASPRAVSKLAYDNHGAVIVQYGQVFHMEWTGGPWSLNEVKDFTCIFNKDWYNKTPNQLKYPDTFGNDGRVDPIATDRMAVYCNVGPRTIEIMGIDRATGKGFALATFKYDDILNASPNPVTIDAKPNGLALLRVDNNDNFYFEWKNGPWSGYESKGFKCRF